MSLHVSLDAPVETARRSDAGASCTLGVQTLLGEFGTLGQRLAHTRPRASSRPDAWRCSPVVGHRLVLDESRSCGKDARDMPPDGVAVASGGFDGMMRACAPSRSGSLPLPLFRLLENLSSDLGKRVG